MNILISVQQMISFTAFLRDHVREYISCGQNQISMDLENINCMVEGVSWDLYLKELFKDKAIRITYGDRNWVTLRFEEA